MPNNQAIADNDLMIAARYRQSAERMRDLAERSLRWARDHEANALKFEASAARNLAAAVADRRSK
jgi:hypothetical protein